MKYLVKFEIGYMEADFEFANSGEAVNFLKMATCNLCSVYNDKDFKASLNVVKGDSGNNEEDF